MMRRTWQKFNGGGRQRCGRGSAKVAYSRRRRPSPPTVQTINRRRQRTRGGKKRAQTRPTDRADRVPCRKKPISRRSFGGIVFFWPRHNIVAAAATTTSWFTFFVPDERARARTTTDRIRRSPASAAADCRVKIIASHIARARVFVCPSVRVCLASHAPAPQRTPIPYAVAAHKVPAFSWSVADNNFNNLIL